MERQLAFGNIWEGTAKSAMEAKEDGVGVIENVPPEQTVNGSLTSAGGVHKNYRSDMMSASELGEEDDVESPSLPEGRCSSSVLTTLQITESGPPRLSRIIFLPENQRVMDFNHIYKTPSKQHLEFLQETVVWGGDGHLVQWLLSNLLSRLRPWPFLPGNEPSSLQGSARGLAGGGGAGGAGAPSGGAGAQVRAEAATRGRAGLRATPGL
ncbi:uncharacterized protein LOC101093758 isoform X2 [Felis catus]|uniref:uncharacterized protein LOC101093758 isoform X2 n=1 Tax=Felis catus TaxID=9685 RepID=UPI001D19F1C9|nr:uncharacterized protein LOC101093758 isoform X2 [Felis catus]